MRIHLRSTFTALGVSVIAMVFIHCATIIGGTSQRIPMTSSPSGAKIFVNGQEMGATPTTLKLKRN